MAPPERSNKHNSRSGSGSHAGHPSNNDSNNNSDQQQQVEIQRDKILKYVGKKLTKNQKNTFIFDTGWRTTG